MRILIVFQLFLLIISTVSGSPLRACNADDLMAAYNKIREPRLDVKTTGIISDFTLEHRDMRLVIHSGRIAFLEPVLLDSETHVFGAYFEGNGQFYYGPSEYDAMNRIEFYRDEDSVKVNFTRLMMAFTGEIYELLRSQIQPTDDKFEKKQLTQLRKSWDRLTEYENHYHIFQILRNTVEPQTDQYLLVNPQENNWKFSYYYIYDPLMSDEIRLMQSVVRGPNWAQYLKTLTSYTCTVRETQEKCGQLAKAQVKADHYNINLSMKNEYGDCTCRTEIEFEVFEAPAQLLWMFLHEEARITCVSSPGHPQIHFLRHEKGKNRCESLYLIFDRPMQVGDRFTLLVGYDAPLFSRSGRDFYGNLGFAWYPVYVDPDSATYNITYRVPYYDDLKFVSTGVLVSAERDGNWVTQKWEVTQPAYKIAIGFEDVEK